MLITNQAKALSLIQQHLEILRRNLSELASNQADRERQRLQDNAI